MKMTLFGLLAAAALVGCSRNDETTDMSSQSSPPDRTYSTASAATNSSLGSTINEASGASNTSTNTNSLNNATSPSDASQPTGSSDRTENPPRP